MEALSQSFVTELVKARLPSTYFPEELVITQLLAIELEFTVVQGITFLRLHNIESIALIKMEKTGVKVDLRGGLGGRLQLLLLLVHGTDLGIFSVILRLFEKLGLISVLFCAEQAVNPALLVHAPILQV